VADKPRFDPPRVRLDVELQAERSRPDAERLDGAQFGRCEALRARRQVAIIAMPVQHGQAFEARERRRAASVRQFDRRIANLLARAGSDPRAERRRHELRPQTHAEDGPLLIETAADRLDLFDKKRVGVSFVDAERAPEHDQEIRGKQGGIGQVVDARLDIGERVAGFGKGVAPDADVLERDMTDRKRRPRHQPFPLSAPSSPGRA
jgi:hypothetical protein